jgi:hypothetical protein
MQISIQTIKGLFVVPHEKEMELISWLEHNAIKAGGQPVYEQGHTITQNPYTGRQLINEQSPRGEY